MNCLRSYSKSGTTSSILSGLLPGPTFLSGEGLGDGEQVWTP